MFTTKFKVKFTVSCDVSVVVVTRIVDVSSAGASTIGVSIIEMSSVSVLHGEAGAAQLSVSLSGHQSLIVASGGTAAAVSLVRCDSVTSLT